MSEPNNAAPAEASSSVQTPTPAAQTPADPNWLPARLERERRALLKELGVEDVTTTKAALEELKRRQDAEKTETERLRAELETYKAQAAKAAEYQSTLKAKAENELKSLTDEQREAILALTGDDPAKQLLAIDKMRAAKFFDKPTPPPPATPPAPATTAAPATAPAPASASGETNHLATYEALRAENPMLAAKYRLLHFSAIQNELKQRG